VLIAGTTCERKLQPFWAIMSHVTRSDERERVWIKRKEEKQYYMSSYPFPLKHDSIKNKN
jgi:hypothetical protein